VRGEGEADNRMSLFPDEPLRAGLVAALQAMLHRHNHWVRVFKRTALENPAVNVQLTIRADGGPFFVDRRTHNAPCAPEVAAVMPGDTEEPMSVGDVRVRLHDGDLAHVSWLSPAVLP